jgi:hypothetical protein
LGRLSENARHTNFAEADKGEVPRIYLLGTPVNKGKREEPDTV